MAFKTYLHRLTLPSFGQEDKYIQKLRHTCYNGIYPFKLFPAKELRRLDFAPITILYGGNGSGKTTLLNIIAQSTGLLRHSPFSGSAFFDDYTSMCETEGRIPLGSQILTSDDVTDYLLHIRNLNNGIDTRRTALMEEYTQRKFSDLRFTSLADYDEWKEGYDSKTKSQSRFVKDRLMRNVDMHSNGETALRYYTERITSGALYLIDEPENSLSAKMQQALSEFLADSARFYGCQFIIATHSPFFLAMDGAKIYDLDSLPVEEAHWTELENVRVYYDFFMQHRGEFG